MLRIVIPEQHHRFFNEATEEFIYVDVKKTELQLEHSLLSIRKWEQKWNARFIRKELEEPLTKEQILDYIRCMTLNKVSDPNVYMFIPKSEYEKIDKYIHAPMTGTTFPKILDDPVSRAKASREGISAELVYYWMFTLGIPIECEKWHFNTLITLIKVFNVKNQKPGKADAKAAAAARRRENERRKRMLHSTG